MVCEYHISSYYSGDHKLIFVSALKTHPPFDDLYSELFSNHSVSQTWGALLLPQHTGKSANLIKNYGKQSKLYEII